MATGLESLASTGLKIFPTKVEAAKYLSLIKKRVKFNKEVRFDINHDPIYFETQNYNGYKISIIDISIKSMANLRKVASGIKSLKMIVRHFTGRYAMQTPAAKKYFTEQSKCKEYTAYIFKTK